MSQGPDNIHPYEVWFELTKTLKFCSNYHWKQAAYWRSGSWIYI